MRCTTCGHEITKGAVFCAYCGEKVAKEKAAEDKPVYESEVKGMLKSGKLKVYSDRTEFTSGSVQKSTFNYSALVSVKKRVVPTPAILFIMEDGQTEACPATMKNIHEAFLYIDQASRPYIEERKKQLLSQGIRYSFVSSSGLTGGILNIMDDKAEFKSKSGQSEAVSYGDVKSVSISKGLGTESLEFSLFDGRVKSFGLDRQVRVEILSFVKEAVAPFIARRKEALLARGIYFSFYSSWSQADGTIDIYEDRVEFTDRAGKTEAVFFRDVRKVGLLSEAMELSMTDGTFRSFSVDRDDQDQVLAFIEHAIEPYVMKRTVGFDKGFGVDERIEFNQERGVFHIIRQDGNVISEEFPIEDMIRCQQIESTELNRVISGVLTGGKTILTSAAGAVGMQTVPDTEEKITMAGVLLTIRTEEGQREEHVRFGSFPLGISRTAPKYGRYAAELSGLMDYLGSRYPGCDLIIPAPLEIESKPEEMEPDVSDEEEERCGIAEIGEVSPSGKQEDPLGIKKYIEGASRYIDKCPTPMTIAIQERWTGGENSMQEMLFHHIKKSGRDTLIWFHTRQFSRSELGEKLPILVGAELINQMGGMGDGRVVKFAKGLINLVSGMITQGGTDGQLLIEAFFKDNAVNSLNDFVKTFSEMVKKKCDESKGKVIVFVDGLDRLSPLKEVELLEAMEYFFDCKGCVFVMTVDYDSVMTGVRERYGQDFDEEKGKKFFDRIFRVSLRLPASDFHMADYIKGKLEHMEISTDDETELECYEELVRSSVGGGPEEIDHLFNSFLLLRTLADEEIYDSRQGRLILFAILCIQAQFREVYDFMVQMKDQMTPDLLSGLLNKSRGVSDHMQLSGEQRTKYEEFAAVFSRIIDMDHSEAISVEECQMFAQVLEVSDITFK